MPLATAAVFLYPQHLRQETLRQATRPVLELSSQASLRSQRTSATIPNGRQSDVGYPAPPLTGYSAVQREHAQLSLAPSVHTRRSNRSIVSNQSVMISGEVFSVVHQITDALLQVTNQSRDDAVARERLLLQQQQIMQRDFVEKEMKEKQILADKEIKEKQILADKEKKRMDKELAEKKILADREKKRIEKEVKEKKLLSVERQSVKRLH